jgi:RNA polymerase sigma-70 factor, ECF subfamily
LIDCNTFIHPARAGTAGPELAGPPTLPWPLDTISIPLNWARPRLGATFTIQSPMASPPPEQQGSPSPGGPVQNSPGSAQPSQERGVTKGMGTVAIAQNGFQGTQQGASIHAAGVDWTQLSDAEIMLRVREGDDSGFSILIEKYRKQMVHFMFRMSRNQAVAEELAQEVFLRVYRSRQTYRAEAKFSTWLYRIATNLGVNHARDTKYERTAQNVYLDQPDPETGTTPDVADSTLSVEQELVREERMSAIRKHVMALPERQRSAVLMHKYQEMDYKEIGEVLKLSESATKSLLFRAYQTLRENLKDFA